MLDPHGVVGVWNVAARHRYSGTNQIERHGAGAKGVRDASLAEQQLLHDIAQHQRSLAADPCRDRRVEPVAFPPAGISASQMIT